MRAALGVITVVCVLASGCAQQKPDWIDRTLVTVDVTGVWEGTITAPASNLAIELDVKQEGAKVTGEIKGFRNFDGNRVPPIPIVGTVSGDTFSFHEASGARQRLSVQVQVNGDDMTGSGSGNYNWGIVLHRRPPQ